MPAIPVSHVQDAHKLIADAEIMMWEIYPVSGGTVYLKNDNDVTWLGHIYEGVPLSLNGEKYESSTSTPTPRLQIGQEDVDLLPFKGLINEGYLDGATIVRHKVLLDNVLSNSNIKESTYYRVKRVEAYSRTKISLVLSTFSGATSQSFPFRQYLPPAFPWVDL